MVSKKEAAKALLTIFGLIALVLTLNLLGHCATTSSKKNAFGTMSYEQNPLMYLAGSLSQSGDAVSQVEGNLNLRINPLGTYMLYDESILFCGRPIDKFQGIEEPFVLTYERVAHRMVDGVGCHELIRVDHLVGKKAIQ